MNPGVWSLVQQRNLEPCQPRWVVWDRHTGTMEATGWHAHVSLPALFSIVHPAAPITSPWLLSSPPQSFLHLSLAALAPPGLPAGDRDHLHRDERGECEGRGPEGLRSDNPLQGL